MSDVSVLLDAIQSGDPEALAQLLSLVYEELRRLTMRGVGSNRFLRSGSPCSRPILKDSVARIQPESRIT
jgi:hypothetical protein